MEIHCKVFFRNDIRRFPMNGVGFLELQKIIQTLFGLEKEFTLQYRDNENDLVVVSSNDELACALSCINGNILQVVVLDSNPPTMDVDQKSTPTPTPPFNPYWGHFGHFRHRGGPPHFPGGLPPSFHGGFTPPFHGGPSHFHGGLPPPFHRHCHFGKDQSRRGCNRFVMKKEMMSQKLKEIESLIMEMAGQEEGTLTPLQQKRLNVLQKKKRNLENHLSKMDEWANPWSGKKSEKCFKKHAKHEKKFMKKMDKHGKLLMDVPFLSEMPDNSELATLHAKFHSLKPELEEIKIQLKASKAALKEAQERGESTDQWLHEISQLKEAKKVKKQQIIPIGIQIRDMHSQSVH